MQLTRLEFRLWRKRILGSVAVVAAGGLLSPDHVTDSQCSCTHGCPWTCSAVPFEEGVASVLPQVLVADSCSRSCCRALDSERCCCHRRAAGWLGLGRHAVDGKDERSAEAPWAIGKSAKVAGRTDVPELGCIPYFLD